MHTIFIFHRKLLLTKLEVLFLKGIYLKLILTTILRCKEREGTSSMMELCWRCGLQIGKY